jgi:uncharacterized membrane protein HdeD (DUF308 family)
MLRSLVRNWWAVLLRGLVAILFGVLAFAWPGLTLLSLVALYAIYCVVDGVAALAAAFVRDEGGKPLGQMIFTGLVSVGAGVAAFLWPGLTAMVLLWIVAAWAIVRGVAEIVAAIRLRREIENEWLLGLAGALSILFGLALFVRPGAGAIALVWFIAAFAIAHGVLLVALAFRLRSLRDVPDRLSRRSGAA